MAVRTVGLLALVLSALLCYTSAEPQGFAYSTTTYQNPFVPIPFARLAFQDYNDIASAPQAVHVQTSQLPPSPYHFLPASLPQAIYSEPAHVLSGYSYQTLDPAGAKSQVLFVSGPNSRRLFRQNANLLHIVLPSLFTAGGDSVIPVPDPAVEAPNIPQSADSESAPQLTPSGENAASGAISPEISSSEDSYDVESRADELGTPTTTSEDVSKSAEDAKESSEDVRSKEEQEKSSEDLTTSTTAPAEKSEDSTTSKPDGSNSEETSPLKTTDSTENASESPVSSEKDATSDEKTSVTVNLEKSSDVAASDEKSSDKSVNEKQSDEKASEEKSNEEKKSEVSVTDNSIVSTTVASSIE